MKITFVELLLLLGCKEYLKVLKYRVRSSMQLFHSGLNEL